MAQMNAEANFQSSTSECQNCDLSALVAKAFSNLMRRDWNGTWKNPSNDLQVLLHSFCPGYLQLACLQCMLYWCLKTRVLMSLHKIFDLS